MSIISIVVLRHKRGGQELRLKDISETFVNGSSLTDRNHLNNEKIVIARQILLW